MSHLMIVQLISYALSKGTPNDRSVVRLMSTHDSEYPRSGMTRKWWCTIAKLVLQHTEPAKGSGDRDTGSGRLFAGAPERITISVILCAISFV